MSVGGGITSRLLLLSVLVENGLPTGPSVAHVTWVWRFHPTWLPLCPTYVPAHPLCITAGG